MLFKNQLVVPSFGSLDASVAFIGESPALNELREGQPFVGNAGKMLNKGFSSAGLIRSEVRLLNAVPVRAPNDKFNEHSEEFIEWGLKLLNEELANLPNLKIVVPLGANPTRLVLGKKPPVANRNREGKGKEGFITEWRGSAIQLDAVKSERPEDYIGSLEFEPLEALKNRGIVVVPTYHPSAVLRQFEWHPLFLLDLKKVSSIIQNGLPEIQYRKWYFNDPAALELIKGVDLIAVDTEMEPALVSIATDEEVFVFEWDESARQYLEPLLTNPKILKVAHNWNHDHAWIRKRMDIEVSRPIFDTMGGAHLLNSSLPKTLSPAISTRFTNWPYHKWLETHGDYIHYSGMDAVVAYDAYWPIINRLFERDLVNVANWDHKLLHPLLDMQEKGFRVNEVARIEVEQELDRKLIEAEWELQELVEPIIKEKLEKFEKPHLFVKSVKCQCCGGGKKQSQHCQQCGLYNEEGKFVKVDREVKIDKGLAELAGFRTIKALKEAFGVCKVCNGSGRVEKFLPFNPDSPDQVSDVLYRGLGIKARKFKGKETIKAASLDAIKDKHPLIAKIVDTSRIRAEYDTVARLEAGLDGKLHCIFDQWGTESGRIAGKEGLVLPGTNPMNLPLPARRFIVPDFNHVFLYPDMAQIEARAVALLSNDRNLKSAFIDVIDWPDNPKHGKIDSHTRVMQLMLNKGGVSINRQTAKKLTYSVMYGGSAKQLSIELNAEMFRQNLDQRYTEQEVQIMIDIFFKVFFGVKRYHENVLEEVARTKRVRCPFTGRERTWSGRVVDRKGFVSHEIAKQVWSYLPQWIGAYVLGSGLIDLYNSEYYGDLIQPLIHVHDALLIQVPEDRVQEAVIVCDKYLSREEFGMVFPSEMKMGMNWLEASGG